MTDEQGEKTPYQYPEHPEKLILTGEPLVELQEAPITFPKGALHLAGEQVNADQFYPEAVRLHQYLAEARTLLAETVHRTILYKPFSSQWCCASCDGATQQGQPQTELVHGKGCPIAAAQAWLAQEHR